MGEMIERVARALAEALSAGELSVDAYFSSEPERVLDAEAYAEFHNFPPPAEFRILARAAIKAMREPTEGMYDALSATDRMWREMNSEFVWKTYIDAALADPPRG